MATHVGWRNAILPIHFFKIFLKTNVERLKIPNKFTARYGGGLSNPVFLKPPDGTEWEVHWTQQNGEVWFEKGWKQFVEKYSLDHGHFVVFKYEGTSKFDVLILDQSALEIDYPSSDNCDEKDKLDQSDDESVKILEEIPPNPKARLKSPVFSPGPHKKRRNTPGNVERSTKSQKLNEGHQSDQGTKFQKSIKNQLKGVKTTRRISSLNLRRAVRAREVVLNVIRSQS